MFKLNPFGKTERATQSEAVAGPAQKAHVVEGEMKPRDVLLYIRSEYPDAGGMFSLVTLAFQTGVVREGGNVLLKYVYENHFDEVLTPGMYSDGFHSAVRTLFYNGGCKQEVFNFVLCCTLAGFKRKDFDFVADDKGYNFSNDTGSLILISQHFDNLKKEIEKGEIDPKTVPWISECVDAFGKEPLCEWLSARSAEARDKAKVAWQKKRLDDDDTVIVSDPESGLITKAAKAPLFKPKESKFDVMNYG